MAWCQLGVAGRAAEGRAGPWGLGWAPGAGPQGAVKVGSPLKSCLRVEEFVLASSPGEGGLVSRKVKSASIFGSSSSNTLNCRSISHHPTPPKPTIQAWRPRRQRRPSRPIAHFVWSPSRPSDRSIGFRSGTPPSPLVGLTLASPYPTRDCAKRRLCIIKSISQISSHQRPTLNSPTATVLSRTSTLEPPTTRASRPCSTRFPDRARRLPDHPATKRDRRAQRPRRRPA